MLLYLTSSRNEELFDFLANEQGIPVKKLSGEFSLKKFVIRDMRNFSHCTHFAVDLEAMRDTEEEISEAVMGFQAMYDSRIIIFAEGREKDDRLLKGLHELGVANIITAQDIEEIKNEIRRCVSETGMSEPEYQESISADEELPEENAETHAHTEMQIDSKGINIAVAGLWPKVGTTTVAMNLAHYLASYGRSSYVELNASGHLYMLPSFFGGMELQEGFIRNGQVDYYYKETKFDFMEYAFNILDLGVLTGRNVRGFTGCAVKVLCGTAKPWELHGIPSVLDMCGDDDISFVFSLTPHSSRAAIRRLVDGAGRIYFGRYSPDLFDGSASRAIWDSIISQKRHAR